MADFCSDSKPRILTLLDNLKLYWKPLIKLKRKLSFKEGFEEATYTVREGLQYAHDNKVAAGKIQLPATTKLG
jgi:hypothetical protein